jgi:ABC-type branched-subunit amino acid transport system substrate-binding protein
VPLRLGLVEGVKNVAVLFVYHQAMTEAVKNLQFLGFKVRLIKPSRTAHPDKAMAKVYP